MNLIHINHNSGQKEYSGIPISKVNNRPEEIGLLTEGLY